MIGRSTERRRPCGLTQVSFDLDGALWPEIMAATGALTKTEAVTIALRWSIEARESGQGKWGKLHTM